MCVQAAIDGEGKVVTATDTPGEILARGPGVFTGYWHDSGATAAALLCRYLRGCGLDPIVHIPDRIFEGYGFAVPINIAQATLGSKVNVRTLDGKKVSIRIPAGTPSGKRFRVRGQGIRKGEQVGDLIVEVDIVVPEKLTEEQERMMREFADAGGLKY